MPVKRTSVQGPSGYQRLGSNAWTVVNPYAVKPASTANTHSSSRPAARTGSTLAFGGTSLLFRGFDSRLRPEHLLQRRRRIDAQRWIHAFVERPLERVFGARDVDLLGALRSVGEHAYVVVSDFEEPSVHRHVTLLAADIVCE